MSPYRKPDRIDQTIAAIRDKSRRMTNTRRNGPFLARSYFDGVTGVAGAAETAGAALMVRPDDAAAGRVVLAGHDARSCVHDGPRPSVSISNVARVVLPSALRVPSPICRREAASIACMASGATTSLHPSYLPTRAGY